MNKGIAGLLLYLAAFLTVLAGMSPLGHVLNPWQKVGMVERPGIFEERLIKASFVAGISLAVAWVLFRLGAQLRAQYPPVTWHRSPAVKKSAAVLALLVVIAIAYWWIWTVSWESALMEELRNQRGTH